MSYCELLKRYECMRRMLHCDFIYDLAIIPKNDYWSKKRKCVHSQGKK